MAELVVRRGADRAVSIGPGRRTAHSFSFGERYDPANLGFGALVALNDERVEPGAGYPDHRHEDVEILTWVVEGVLTHRDSTGARTRVAAGQVAVQSAGAGVVHSETVASGDPATRFVQCWLRPAGDHEPAYAVADVTTETGWRPLTSETSLRAAGRAYAAAVTDEALALPPGDRLLLFVVAGTVTLVADGRTETLGEGDDARLVGVRAQVSGHGEVLVWVLDPGQWGRESPDIRDSDRSPADWSGSVPTCQGLQRLTSGYNP